MSLTSTLAADHHALRILMLDFDAYFTAAEQHLQPYLRGKPVIVTPVPRDAGCCIAVSYQARAFGIKTGTLVREARRLCPQVAVVQSRPRDYVRLHHQIREAIDRCLPIAEVGSIDEMVCRLGAGQRLPEQALRLAEQVKRSIATHVGHTLTCSVGLAPNRLIAKIATKINKPDGLTIIGKHELPTRLLHMELDDLPGIAEGMTARLHLHGIKTVHELCHASCAQLRQVWGGVVGERWWHALRGDEVYEPAHKRATMSHQHVIPWDQREDTQARAIAMRLLHKAGERARLNRYAPSRLVLSLSLEGPRRDDGRTERGPRFEAEAQLNADCNDTVAMTATLGELWSRRPPGRVKQVCITLAGLGHENNATLPLFEAERRQSQLSTAIDRINARYGRHAVYFGAVHAVRDYRLGGIAFRSIPELELSDTVGGPGDDALGGPMS